MIPLGILAGAHSAAAAPGGFTPLSLPGLDLWLDASDLPDGPVGTWADKSGSENHATQTTLALQPTKAGGLVLFGGAHGLDTAASASGSQQTFFVAASVADNSTRTLLGPNATGGAISVEFGSNRRPRLRQWGISGLFAQIGNAPVLDRLTTIAAWYDSGEGGGIRRDDVAEATITGTYTTPAGTLIRVGTKGTGAEYHNGAIAEAIHCSARLDEADIVACMQYLAAKWGTPSPSGA